MKITSQLPQKIQLRHRDSPKSYLKMDAVKNILGAHVVRRFQNVVSKGVEKEYYPAYNILLYTHFKPEDNYVVAPVTYPTDSRESIDLTVEFIVEENNNPVLVLEIKPDTIIRKKSSRAEADEQIRKRLVDIADTCVLNRLCGIVAFGTHICLYTLNVEDSVIEPEAIERSRNYTIDVAPIEWWKHDIMTVEGAEYIVDIFNNVKTQCSSI